MKKIIVSLIVIACIIGLIYIFVDIKVTDNPENNIPSSSSQGNQVPVDSPSSPDIPKEPAVNNLRVLEYFKNFTAKKMYLKAITDVEDDSGKSIKSTVEMSVDNKNYAVNMPGINYSMIIRNDVMYSIMHEEKQYIKMDATDDDSLSTTSLLDNVNKYSEDTLISSGNVTIGTTTYYYEEFKIDNTTEKLYFIDADLKRVDVTENSQTTTMEILEFSNTPKQSMFELPKGYTEMTF